MRIPKKINPKNKFIIKKIVTITLYIIYYLSVLSLCPTLSKFIVKITHTAVFPPKRLRTNFQTYHIDIILHLSYF